MNLKANLARVASGISVASLLTFLSMSSAHAALPVAVTDALTSFKTDATDLITAGWPVLVAVFGGMVLMKLFKKVGNKAT